ncbi:uncharacterized protein B0I36DRAFT_428567 [Microdochium trichocladiopsis]|uniref:Uncharacterized protein n=1 Tax=Microdochium trichocladiopsis TaxID=1682393 RepID=A0A9P9BUW9_9PEZI|nr:uncharacterized protein B0I36DRAFT_428567 [Microdochium trichocladiopsis]KAH7038066.1 hypothetical protein B0I36DRAFT_428567 [Microdochium trichocladiopsis]
MWQELDFEGYIQVIGLGRCLVGIDDDVVDDDVYRWWRVEDPKHNIRQGYQSITPPCSAEDIELIYVAVAWFLNGHGATADLSGRHKHVRFALRAKCEDASPLTSRTSSDSRVQSTGDRIPQDSLSFHTALGNAGITERWDNAVCYGWMVPATVVTRDGSWTPGPRTSPIMCPVEGIAAFGKLGRIG